MRDDGDIKLELIPTEMPVGAVRSDLIFYVFISKRDNKHYFRDAMGDWRITEETFKHCKALGIPEREGIYARQIS